MPEQLKQTTSEKIIEKLKDRFKAGGTFKQFFDGDPRQISADYLPCIVVDEQNVRPLQAPTGMDKNEITLIIKVIMNKRDDFGKSDKEAVTKKKLKVLVRGKDSTTGEYLDQSVFGCLREQFTLDNFALNQSTSVDYFQLDRPGNVATEEAWITIIIEELTTVSSRT